MGGEGESSRDNTTSREPLDHILTHDINNHLNIIQGQTDLLLADVDDPDIVDRLETIKRQTIASSALLQTVGDTTRGASGVEYETVDLGSILSIEIDRLQSAYSDANITSDIDEGVQARADELLQSVCANLIENALQHSNASSPKVHVTAAAQEGSAIISVEDDGPGLPDEVRDQLLGRDLAHPQSGVHIVRSLVKRYGGDISVETGSDGTKVTLALPSE